MFDDFERQLTSTIDVSGDYYEPWGCRGHDLPRSQRDGFSSLTETLLYTTMQKTVSLLNCKTAVFLLL